MFGEARDSRLMKMENSRRATLAKNEFARRRKPRDHRISQENASKGSYFHAEGTEDVDMEPDIFEKAKKVFVEK